MISVCLFNECSICKRWFSIGVQAAARWRGFVLIYFVLLTPKVKRSRSPAERVQSSSLHARCLPFKGAQRTNTVPALPWAVFDTLRCAWTLPLLPSVGSHSCWPAVLGTVTSFSERSARRRTTSRLCQALTHAGSKQGAKHSPSPPPRLRINLY